MNWQVIIYWKCCKRLNNFSKTIFKGVAVGALFFIPTIIARSSINSTTRNRAALETPLARPQPDQGRQGPMRRDLRD